MRFHARTALPGRRVRRALTALLATGATTGALVAVSPATANAALLPQFSDVGITVSAPATAPGTFGVTAKVTNTAASPGFSRSGDSLTFSVTGGSISGVTGASGCSALPAASVTCSNVDAGLTPGQSATAVASVVPTTSPVRASATVTAPATQPDILPIGSNDTDPGDDSQSASTVVQPDLDVSAQSSTPTEVSPPGGAFASTFTVRNDGPTAETATITDAISGASFASINGVTASGATCTAGASSVSCSANLASQASTTVQVIIQTKTTSGTVTNAVSATAPGTDSDGNNTGSQSTSVLNDPNQASTLLASTQSLSRNSSNQNATLTNSASVPELNTVLSDDNSPPSGFYNGLTALFTSESSVVPDTNHTVTILFSPNNFDPCHGLGLSSGCASGRIFWNESTEAPESIPSCPGFTNPNSPGSGTDPLVDSSGRSEPCINNITKVNGQVQYELRLVKDVNILGIL